MRPYYSGRYAGNTVPSEVNVDIPYLVYILFLVCGLSMNINEYPKVSPAHQ